MYVVQDLIIMMLCSFEVNRSCGSLDIASVRWSNGFSCIFTLITLLE